MPQCSLPHLHVPTQARGDLQDWGGRWEGRAFSWLGRVGRARAQKGASVVGSQHLFPVSPPAPCLFFPPGPCPMTPEWPSGGDHVAPCPSLWATFRSGAEGRAGQPSGDGDGRVCPNLGRQAQLSPLRPPLIPLIYPGLVPGTVGEGRNPPPPPRQLLLFRPGLWQDPGRPQGHTFDKGARSGDSPHSPLSSCSRHLRHLHPGNSEPGA